MTHSREATTQPSANYEIERLHAVLLAFVDFAGEGLWKLLDR
jgi:hypothetical protein